MFQEREQPMSHVFYTNTREDFSEIKKIEGTLGKPVASSRQIPEDCFLFREEQPNNGKPKTFSLKRIDPKRFFLKRYWYLASLILLLSILYAFYSPIIALLLFVGMEAFIYYGKPFSSVKKAKLTLITLKAVAVVLFIISGFLLFGGLGNIDSSLRFSQTTMFGTLIAFARYYAQGIFNKYREIYKLVGDCEADEDDSNIFVWKKQI